MNAFTRMLSGGVILGTLFLTACGTPVPTGAPTQEMRLESAATEEATEAPYDYAPAATAAPAFDEALGGPSTGGSAEPNDQPYGDVFFENYGVNPVIDTEDDHFSTFAVDVDTASYTVMRRYLADGNLPDKDSVRVEEYINFFDQEYTPPTEGAFAIHLEGSPAPYGENNYYLVRVGLKGYEVPAEERKPVVLTFVIDVSGSMGEGNRLALVKQALQLLVQNLRPTDKVAVVVYGDVAHVVLEHTPVSESNTILQAINRLQTEGATNAEDGLKLGYQLADQAFEDGAINRVILCSDGVANVGNTGPDSILQQIRRYADNGIFMTTVGFGMGNYNDVLMEQLADDGDGFYAYVDDIKEAERVFVNDLTSSLQVIAKDAKIQVDFNPQVVARYRLIGYENRDVADEDFRNDNVDAGEIGVGHSVTALYEVKFQREIDPQATAMTVAVRYADPDSGNVTEISRSIAQADLATAFEATSPRFQLDAVAAEYAEILRESYWARGSTLEALVSQARRIADALPQDAEVREFADLVARAAQLRR